jgi:hypothetical protein
METTTIMSLPEVTTENIKKAIESLKQYAAKKKYVFSGNVDSLANVIPTFSSQNQEKKFRWALLRAMRNPTMKSANLFFNQYSKSQNGVTPKLKMEYSEKEKQIKAARKEWKELQAKAEEARLKYRETKGDFYKS